MAGIKMEDFNKIIDKLDEDGVISGKLSRDLDRQFV
jgi:hypothetical protein